jgi:hypothetical protein
MARRLGIPLLLDVVRVDDLREIRSLAADRRVDRVFGRSGRLLNRVLQGRILDQMRVNGRLLPAFLPRDDATRVAGQEALERRLASRDIVRWNNGELDAIAAYVSGEGNEDALGPAVQQLVGRLFFPDYQADAASYAAARLVDAYPGAKPWRALWWRLSGRLRRARRLLWERAQNDGHAIHATTIAFHNIVLALNTMRELLADPVRAGRLTEDNVVPQCLSAPPRLLRRSTDGFETPALPRRMRRGALIVFELKDALAGYGDARDAFMTESWSRCPAHGLVRELLRAVYRRAAGGREA